MRILEEVRGTSGGAQALNAKVFSALFCGQGIFRCRPLRMHAFAPEAKTLEAAIAAALEAKAVPDPPNDVYSLEQLLVLAATAGMASACQLLLSAGSDPNTNCGGQSGQSPISAAACSGSSDTVTALVAAGASVESEDSIGRRPLNVAACFGLTGCVETLLELGATVDGAFGDAVLGARPPSLRPPSLRPPSPVPRPPPSALRPSAPPPSERPPSLPAAPRLA